MRQCYVKLSGILLVFVASLSMLQAAPPEVPKEIKATPGQLVRITVKTDKKIGTAKNFADEDGFFGELVAPTGQRQFVFQPPIQNAKSSYVLTFWTEGELEGSTCTITLSGVVPPTPPNPPVPPDPPTPPPIVSSFRVIFIWESMSTLTAQQNSVINGVDMANFLNSKTTKSGVDKGWRLKDKDSPVNNDTPIINELWSSVKGQITSTTPIPCVAVEVNGKVEIINLKNTQAEMIAEFKKYIGEK